MKWANLLIIPTVLVGIVMLLTEPFTRDSIVTIAGLAMLTFAYLITAYFEITKMRTDEQGRRFYYTVWGWFNECVLRRKYDASA